MSLEGGAVALAGALGSGEVGEEPYLLVAVGILLSFLTIQVLWKVVHSDDDQETPDQHHADGMIVCPECGEPTETEYRFCRVCAGDTGKGYVDIGEGDDSSRSGMF